MKKFTCFILVLIFIFISLAACSNELIENNKVIEMKMDLEGRKIIILQSMPEADVLAYKENTDLCDIVIQRLSDVGEAYNCDINIEAITAEATFKQSLKNAMAANDELCDIIFSYPHMLRDLGNAGGLLAIDEVSDIIDATDYEKWSTPNVQEMIMCKGVLYGVIPALWVNMFTPVYYNIAINEDLVKQAGQPDPREYVEQKVWTRDKLVETIVNLSQLTVEPKIFGISAEGSHLVRMAVMGNDVKMAMIEDGKVTSGWDTDAAIEGMTWIQDVISKHGDCFYNGGRRSGGDPWAEYSQPFYDEIAAMYLTSSEQILKDVIYKIKDFGLVPFPAGPYVDYGKWPGFFETASIACIPTFANEYEASAYLIDEIFNPFYEYPDAESILNYYRHNIFHDPRDVESLFSLEKNSQYYYWSDGGDSLIYSLGDILTSKTSPAKAIKSNISSVQKCLDEQVVPNWIAMDKHGMGAYADADIK